MIVRALTAARVPLSPVLLAVLLAGACASSEEATPSTTSFATLADVPGAGYQLEVTNRGATPWRPIVQPAPVGSVTHYRVDRTEGGNSNRSGAGSVELSALVSVEVIRSAADGSNQRLVITLIDTDASDPDLTAGLATAVGASLQVERDAALGVTDVHFVEPDGIGQTASRYGRQLLEAPILVSGPLSPLEVGPGATWESALTGPGAGLVLLEHSLDAFVDNSFELAVELGGERASAGTAMLVGRVGQVLPDEQTITLDGGVTISIVRTD